MSVDRLFGSSSAGAGAAAGEFAQTAPTALNGRDVTMTGHDTDGGGEDAERGRSASEPAIRRRLSLQSVKEFIHGRANRPRGAESPFGRRDDELDRRGGGM